MKAIRRWIGYRLWSLASWVYPYDDPERDNTERRTWEGWITFEATQEQADAVFEQLGSYACGQPDHHPLEPCNFVVGSLRPLPDEEDE